ncbi:MAG: MmcQ/YjbR family DNA-binding protein [Flavobacteriales bacterium]|nr:MmcQ/YjbR family DNA-binding protein [Flavobacteriales bacterium]
MDIEQIRIFCLSLGSEIEECYPFDDTSLVFKTGGKMFALLDIQSAWMALKCQPEQAIALREEYEYVTPAYHFNKKHWNGIDTVHAPSALLSQWISNSYQLVRKKAKKNIKNYVFLQRILL